MSLNNDDQTVLEGKQNQNYDTVGPEDTEVAGPGGPNLTGGDVTAHQNAPREADESTQARLDTDAMEVRQQAGEVGKQREDLHPAAEDSAGGEAMDESLDEMSEDHEDAKKNSENQPTELEETKAQLLQVAADFENFRRSAARRETEIREYAVRGVLEDLLPVLDNFERAVGAAENTSDVKSLKIGVEYILQQFQEALKSSGAEPIDAVGKPFDPMKHEALEQVESEDQPGTVVDDVQRGYIFKGKVIRPSRVRVAK